MLHENHSSSPIEVDRPIVVVPVGPGAHPVPKPYRSGFNFLPGVIASEGLGPNSAFYHEEPTEETVKLLPAGHSYNANYGPLNTPTAMFESDSQQLYGIIKPSPEDNNAPITLATVRDAVTAHWNEIEATHTEVTYDTVGEQMNEAIRKAKEALVAAGAGGDKLSAGMTMVKLFRHKNSWGVAIAQLGNTTDAFATDTRLPGLHGHHHVPKGQIGRTKSLHQPEYNPLPKPTGKITKHLHYEHDLRQSSLTSDAKEQPDANRVLVLNQIPSASKIVLSNDAVTGSRYGTPPKPVQTAVQRYISASDGTISARQRASGLWKNLDQLENDVFGTLPKHKQTLAQREVAMLGHDDPAGIAAAMFDSLHDPEGALLVIDMYMPPEPVAPTIPILPQAAVEAVTARTSRVIEAAKRAAKFLQRFAAENTPQMQKRRQQAAEVLAMAALVGAAVYLGKHQSEQIEASVKKVKSSKAVKKAGNLALTAGKKANKRAAESVRKKMKPATMVAKETAQEFIAEAIKPIIVKPVAESIAAVASKRDRLVGRAANAGVKAKRVVKRTTAQAVKLRRSRS